mgnify:CR=1 FL=1
MFKWLPLIILSYLFFALSSLGDKLVLKGPPKPLAYTFYTALVGCSVIILLPFFSFTLPSQDAIFFILIEPLLYLAALYFMFLSIEKFDITRVALTMGSAQPIFLFSLVWLWQGNQIINNKIIFALVLLLIGNILVSLKGKSQLLGKYLTPTLFASFLFSLDYIFIKIVFNKEGVLAGLFWIRLLAAFFALSFLFSKKIKNEISSPKIFINKKILSLIIFTFSMGGLANLLQAFAISLVPPLYLPILNALRGLHYFFLFLLVFLISKLFPHILKEAFTKEEIIKKIGAIIFISAGLFILTS